MKFKVIISIVFFFNSVDLMAMEYPSHILNKNFGEQCRVLDSIRNTLYEKDYSSSVSGYQELENWAGNKGDYQLQSIVKLYRYKFDIENRKTDAGLEQKILKFINDAEENKRRYFKAEGLQLIAEYYWETKNFAASLENYIHAFESYSGFSIDEFPHKAEYIYQIGGRYYHYRDFKTAKKYFMEVLQKIPFEKLDNGISKLNTLALCYRNLEEYDSSLYYFNKTLGYAVKNNDNLWIGIINGNLGFIKTKQRKYDEAIPLIEKNIASSRKFQAMGDLSVALSELGALLLLKKEYKKDLELQREALDIIKQKNMYLRYEITTRIYPNVAKAYAANGFLDSAYSYSDSTNSAKDSLEKHRNTIFLSGVQHKIDVEKHNAELLKKEAEVKQQKLYRNSLFGGLAVVLLFAGVFLIQRNKIKKGKSQSDELLLNILPVEVAEELKAKGTADAKHFENVTVLFTDFKSFTTVTEDLSPQELVGELHTCFKKFDEIIEQYGIEKIKTIGDAYLAVCGLPLSDRNHAVNVVNAAIAIRDFIKSRRHNLGERTFEIRIGINSGSVVAGIVGVKKFAYDIWGDTVNTAARMEQNSEAGKINISEMTYELVKDKFICEYRGEIDAKNKGKLKMYFVEKARNETILS